MTPVPIHFKVFDHVVDVLLQNGGVNELSLFKYDLVLNVRVLFGFFLFGGRSCLLGRGV